MAEDKMMVVGVFPILLILGVLLIFGVTWLFHHHHWRPFAGLFLLVAGLVCLWTLVVRQSALPIAEQLPRTVRPSWGIEPKQGESSDVRSTSGESPLVREYMSKQRITAEKPVSTATTTSGAAQTAEKPADHPQIASSGNSGSTAAGNTKDADKKPFWIGQPLHRGEYDGQQVSLAGAAAGPYSTTDECERAIIPVINEIVAHYVRNDERLAELSDTDLALDANYIRDNLVKQWYTETVEASFGPMYQLHALVVFDDRVQRELESLVRTARVAGRLKYAAAGTVVTLLLLGGVYSILKKGTGRPTAAAT